jgi:hypothetical protein
MSRHRLSPLSGLGVLLAALVPVAAPAATYTVGPSGRQYTQLTTLMSNVDLGPGDIVLVDGNATYNGGIVVGDDDSGSSASPVTIRWTRAAGETRPLLQGGSSTIKFEQSHFVTLEGFDITGGSFACVFNEANGTLVRDVLVRDCPSHGILGADQNSGSFTLEYSEVRRSGSGTTRHSMYMQNDEVLYPNAVFRMRYNYVHDGNGGILMRTRYSRSEIYYNWFESSTNEEVEFIGPDCEAQKASWTPDLVREDTDFVGNVIVHTSTWRNAIRTGGDLVGRNQGRVRLVNNTIIFDRPGIANAVRVQLGTESVEMHNNVVHQTGSSVPNVVEENYDVATPYCAPFDTAPWSNGRKVAGSNNWVKSGSNMVPPEWTATRSGIDPGFEDLAIRRLRPSAGSPLVDGGNSQPQTPVAFPFPSPLLLPAFDPPPRVKPGLNGRSQRPIVGARIDIGALEQAGSGAIPRNGSRPLLPPRPTLPPIGSSEAAVPEPVSIRPSHLSPADRAATTASGRAGFRPSPWLGTLVAWPLPGFLWVGSPVLLFWWRALF